MSYVIQDSDEGDCSQGHPLKLMTHRQLPDGYPAFLICFLCQEVTMVDGDDGQVVQYKGGKRKRFLKPKTKKEGSDVRSLRKSHQRRRRHHGK